MRLKACLCCGSSNLITDGFLTGRYRTRVAKDANPSALLFPGRECSELFAVICGDCGHVHSFARETDGLRSVKSQRRTDRDLSPSEGKPLRIRCPQP